MSRRRRLAWRLAAGNNKLFGGSNIQSAIFSLGLCKNNNKYTSKKKNKTILKPTELNWTPFVLRRRQRRATFNQGNV